MAVEVKKRIAKIAKIRCQTEGPDSLTEVNAWKRLTTAEKTSQPCHKEKGACTKSLSAQL